MVPMAAAWGSDVGHLEERFWDSGRRESREPRPGDARSQIFGAFVPHPIAGWSPLLDSRTWQQARAAEDTAAAGCAAANSEALGRAHWLLVRLESVASSLIEGVRSHPRSLAVAEAQLALGRTQPEPDELEVITNIAATEHALRIGSSTQPVTVADVCAIHRTLMGDTPITGEVRHAQNWIGTRYSSPLSAHYVPPPPQRVPHLLEDVVASIHEAGHPPLVHAAMVHAQFEAIHPFADGNGRTGRALIQLMLHRSGLTTASALAVSLTLVYRRDDYIAALNRAHSPCDTHGPQRSAALADWVVLLADAIRTAAGDTDHICGEVAMIQQYWRDLLSSHSPRSSAVTASLLEVLSANPMLTVNRAAALVGANPRTAARSIQRLRDATIVTRTGTNERNRVHQASDIIDLYCDLGTINPSGWQTGRPPRRYRPQQGHTPTPR